MKGHMKINFLKESLRDEGGAELLGFATITTPILTARNIKVKMKPSGTIYLVFPGEVKRDNQGRVVAKYDTVHPVSKESRDMLTAVAKGIILRDLPKNNGGGP